jgi:hypothetical protein
LERDQKSIGEIGQEMIFSAPAILTRLAFTKDGGLSIGFATNELTDKDKVIASQFHGKFGHVLFKENEITPEEIPDADATDESKSPAQRLRATLFVLWKQRGKKGDFESFYRLQMENAIDRVKACLD